MGKTVIIIKFLTVFSLMQVSVAQSEPLDRPYDPVPKRENYEPLQSSPYVPQNPSGSASIEEVGTIMSVDRPQNRLWFKNRLGMIQEFKFDERTEVHGQTTGAIAAIRVPASATLKVGMDNKVIRHIFLRGGKEPPDTR